MLQTWKLRPNNSFCVSAASGVRAPGGKRNTAKPRPSHMKPAFYWSIVERAWWRKRTNASPNDSVLFSSLFSVIMNLKGNSVLMTSVLLVVIIQLEDFWMMTWFFYSQRWLLLVSIISATTMPQIPLYHPLEYSLFTCFTCKQPST